MKKVSALSLAAFYLLLTTGLYVCILHCTADYFLGTHKTEVAKHSEKPDHHKEKKEGHEEKECGKDANCSCCDKHGEYVIKENVPAGPKIHAVAVALGILHAEVPGTLVSAKEITSITWPHGNAPPFVLKQPLYISYRSLLI